MNNKPFLSILAALLLLLGGCASVPNEPDPADPLEGFNRAMYSFNEQLDKAILKPVAKGYQTIMPDPADKAVSNFFSNLDDVWVLINDLLQFKIHQALEDFTRVAFNTSFGILGLIDVATDMGLPKHDEDFGQTLGYWGVDTGPYLVLPFFGPSNFRDGFGLWVDSFGDIVWREVKPNSDRNALYGLRVIDKRADLLRAEKIMREAALDPYVFLRESYLQRRKFLIRDGHMPEDDFGDLFDDEDGDNGAATP
jgi:phospholipid-binding lipoprotein MlaA